ncbi:hypothetical protein DDE01_07280 [Desulfovibrio desulfuricans]|nr:hypothetical protein DDE01_07280 [Desulfovibrio desulfuricans]
MPSFRRSVAAVVTALPLIAGGCAHRPAVETASPEAVQWNLSDGAETTFYYLMLDQAARSDNTRDAIEAIENLIRLSPTARVYNDSGSFLLSRKEPDLARDILTRGAAAHPDDLGLTLLLAESYLDLDRNDEAIALLRAYNAKHPKDDEARQELAQLLVKTRRYEEADKLILSIGETSRTSLLRYYHARALMGLNRLTEATAQLRKAVKASPDFLEAWAELAYVYELRKNYVEAEKIYEQILALDEGNQDVWLRLVAINIKLNNPVKAYELARQGPETFGFMLTAATLFLDDRFFEQAEGLLLAVKDSPGAPEEVYFFLAVLAYEGQRDTDATLSWLLEVRPTNKYYDRALRLRSQLLYEKGDLEAALRTAREGRETFPEQRDFREMEAQLLVNMGRSEEALRVIDKAADRWPDDSGLLFMRALILDDRGAKDAAFAAMEEVIKASPDHAQALNYVGYTLAEQERDLTRAVSLLERANTLSPDNPFILDSLAWAYFKAGRLPEAWKAISRAIELNAPDPIIWEHYGDIATAMGQKNTARRAYRKALSMNPQNPDAIKAKLDKK